MAEDEEAVVFACTSLVFRAPDLHQSQEQLRKSEVDMSTPVHAVATPITRIVRVARVALVVTRVSRSVARQARLVPKCMGYIACRVVSCRVMP